MNRKVATMGSYEEIVKAQDRWRLYKKMAENMAEMIPNMNLLEADRVDGCVICGDCGLPYHDHPEVFHTPTFHLTCTGRIVKT